MTTADQAAWDEAEQVGALSLRTSLRKPAPPVGPELVWPGKHDVAVVPLAGHRRAQAGPDGTPRLRPVVTVGEPDTPNLLIEGDNAEVMGTLLHGTADIPSMRSAVKLCYLDPPFNTGERFGHYDDLSDTSSWLHALRGRLLRMRELLSPDGSIWLHLDDSEQHHGRCLMDEVFGRSAFVSTVIWQKRTSRDNRTAFSSAHDYIHVYAPSGAKQWKLFRNGLPDTGAFANPDDDPRGPWRSVPLSAQSGHGTASQFYTVVSPTGMEHDPPPGRCWTYTKSRFEDVVADGRVYWPRNGDGRPRLKRYAFEVTGLSPSTLWLADEVGNTAIAKKELLRLFPERRTVFDTPKPEQLMQRILHIGSDPGDVVLDGYLGSGTTAAVAHKTGRRWVGIESMKRTIVETALPRLRRVVQDADGGGISSMIPWRGGGGFTVYQSDSSAPMSLSDAEPGDLA